MRFNNASDGTAGDAFPQAVGGYITLGVVHAPAHIGVNRNELVFNAHLAIGELRQGNGGKFEVVGGGPAAGAGGKADFTCLCHDFSFRKLFNQFYACRGRLLKGCAQSEQKDGEQREGTLLDGGGALVG